LLKLLIIHGIIFRTRGTIESDYTFETVVFKLKR